MAVKKFEEIVEPKKDKMIEVVMTNTASLKAFGILRQGSTYKLPEAIAESLIKEKACKKA